MRSRTEAKLPEEVEVELDRLCIAHVATPGDREDRERCETALRRAIARELLEAEASGIEYALSKGRTSCELRKQELINRARAIGDAGRLQELRARAKARRKARKGGR